MNVFAVCSKVWRYQRIAMSVWCRIGVAESLKRYHFGCARNEKPQCLPGFHFFWRRRRIYLHDHFTSKNGTKTMKALKKGFKLTALTNKKASFFSLLALFVEPLFWSFGGEGGIRTPGGMTLNSFQDCRNRPLCHFSEGKSTIFFNFATQFVKIIFVTLNSQTSP